MDVWGVVTMIKNKFQSSMSQMSRDSFPRCVVVKSLACNLRKPKELNRVPESNHSKSTRTVILVPTYPLRFSEIGTFSVVVCLLLFCFLKFAKAWFSLATQAQVQA